MAHYIETSFGIDYHFWQAPRPAKRFSFTLLLTDSSGLEWQDEEACEAVTLRDAMKRIASEPRNGSERVVKFVSVVSPMGRDMTLGDAGFVANL